MAKIRASTPPPSFQLIGSPVGLDEALHGLDQVDHGKRVVLVSGAGPSGLAIANRLKRDGFDVVVDLDSRQKLDRVNCVNIKAESIDHAAQLGALQPLLESRADQIFQHELYDEVRGTSVHKQAPPLAPKTPEAFNRASYLKGQSVITTPINEAQHAFNVAAVAAGVVVAAKASLSVERGPDGFFRAKVTQGDRSWSVARPDLIVVAEGARSKTREAAGIELLNGKGEILETWAIGSVAYPAESGFQALTVFDQQPFGLVNAMVNSKLGEINVNVTLPAGSNPTPEETGPILQARAAAMLNHHNASLGIEKRYAPDELPLTWVLESVVHVIEGRASAMTAGLNVVMAGDTAYHSSPIAGMGINLGTSSHVEAASTLGQAILTGGDREAALEQYARTLNESGELWHSVGNAKAASYQAVR
jgi:2-polyprenyl-6-methoxyphenol hydroxylase-like FAD-dependent oxidoreductase